MLVIGDKEMAEGKIATRTRSGKSLDSMTTKEFIDIIKRESDLTEEVES